MLKVGWLDDDDTITYNYLCMPNNIMAPDNVHDLDVVISSAVCL
jgi:hypothetical protein